jgi:hypothetical protein
VIENLREPTVVDAASALFRVANSGQEHPTAAATCKTGTLPVNPYPLQVRDSPATVVSGGRFAGEVPLDSDWEDTYCNSAAVMVRGSPDVVVEGLRMRRLWDAVRWSEGSPGFVLRGSWISEVRDDCVENDFLYGGLIEDVLLDGCFSGLSTRPPKERSRVPSESPVVLRGVLMRMQSYLYKGRLREGPPFKADADGPRIDVHDSIIVMGNPDNVSGRRVSIGWEMIGDCSGNLLLWTADTPWPEEFGRPPECFQLIEGAAARERWAAARQGWIDCHPDLVRFQDDDAPGVSGCPGSAPVGSSFGHSP